MKQHFRGWKFVKKHLVCLANRSGAEELQLNDGQRASLLAISERIHNNGIIIADEVGMGKTRIAVAVARSVIEAGGRVAILVPPGLGFQWQDELCRGGIENTPPILRSLKQFLGAWESDTQNHQQPWFDHDGALLISHAFTNWRLGEKSDSWRWALLPEMYAQWRKQSKGRYPHGYHDNEKISDERVRQAADSIVSAICNLPSQHQAHELIDELADKTPWPTILNPGAYKSNDQIRPWLERAVGLGLGTFDLIIIDEAHKSRGSESGLSRLLERVVVMSESARRFAMTATPVELGVGQWTQILGRIKVNDKLMPEIEKAIKNYSIAVNRVRQSPSNEESRRAYKKEAETFQSVLSDYLLRRDKREDPYVQMFANHTKVPLHTYRQENEIIIDTGSLCSSWKQAVCAAEALSMVTRQSDDPIAKRLRLTLGNGHGISALLDQIKRDAELDKNQEEHDGIRLNANVDVEMTPSDKRHARAKWWLEVIERAFEVNDTPLYDHPAILAAVEAIENACTSGEKVLVFGRFTAPMQALVELLNAREMLCCLRDNHTWPQAKVHEGEWDAIQVAHRQLKISGKLTRRDLDKRLDQQYRELENQRDRYRNKLIKKIEEGLKDQQCNRAKMLFNAFKQSTEDSVYANDALHPLAVVAKAMQELTGFDNNSSKQFSAAFIDIVNASSDRDEGDTDGDGELDENEAAGLWKSLIQRLSDEYNRPEGGFARLMYGGTKPDTRRLLQLAFNRQGSYPKVLVAQSMVGREGLNLHEACRIVILLHPEWNPGVVEQQIGRVDRVGSLWEKQLDEAVLKSPVPENLPRIQVRPVIFKGTYDEKNWEVLRERWDDLRAQLHGIVISSKLASQLADAESIIMEINGSAPNFSPSRTKS